MKAQKVHRVLVTDGEALVGIVTLWTSSSRGGPEARRTDGVDNIARRLAFRGRWKLALNRRVSADSSLLTRCP
jgi:hypothetical protein